MLCFRTNRDKILPKFNDPESPKFQEIASELVDVFSASVGDVRENLEDRAKQILEGFPISVVVGRGLEKLLLDRTEFDTEAKTELHELREKVFRKSSELLCGNGQDYMYNLDKEDAGVLETYRSAVAGSSGFETGELSRQLYGDLPPFQQVLQFRKLTGEGLLHRYNCAQVQGLLLRSEGITVTLPDSGAAKLRQLLKYLRFNKLLAKISFDHKKQKSLVLKIDGPLSLFLNTQKYGFNLANFFPAILQQPEWELEAEIRIRKNRSHILHLDQSCGIRSHYRQFLAYVPEEIQLLSQQLEKKLPDWKLSSSADFVPLPGESLCFPDFLLTHSSGKKVALELFHSWHSAPLLNRLAQLDAQKWMPLLIGVNRSLIKNEELADQVYASPYFSRFGFLFRETPTATKLLPLLKAWLRNCEKTN